MENDKLELKHYTATPDTINQGYIIGFLSSRFTELVFLAYTADINKICYSNRPYLPGTGNYKLAKIYSTLEDAKADIYKLRYYHREFLAVKTFIKPIFTLSKLAYTNKLDNITTYYLDI